jgi:hypothetical protein
MPWTKLSPMDQRQQFLAERGRGHFTRRELCERSASTLRSSQRWPSAGGPRYVADVRLGGGSTDAVSVHPCSLSRA